MRMRLAVCSRGQLCGTAIARVIENDGYDCRAGPAVDFIEPAVHHVDYVNVVLAAIHDFTRPGVRLRAVVSLDQRIAGP